MCERDAGPPQIAGRPEPPFFKNIALPLSSLVRSTAALKAPVTAGCRRRHKVAFAFQLMMQHPSVLPSEIGLPRKRSRALPFPLWRHPVSTASPAASPRIRFIGTRGFSAILRAVPIGFGLVALAVIALSAIANYTSSCSCDVSPTTTAKLFTQESITTPLTAFRIHNRRFPTTAEGIVALAQAPRGLESSWHGPYVVDYRKLIDPWGHPYQYRCPGVHNPAGYDVWSLGPDGTSGTPDDIGNWTPTES